MGRKSNAQKAAEAAAMNQSDASADNGATATAEAPAADRIGTTIAMIDFQALPNRADYVSIRDAAKRVFGDKYETKNDQTIRNAAKKRDEFKTDGAAYSVVVEGYDIPPLTYVNVAAVDLYVANNASGSATGRAGRNGRKREIVRPTPEQRARLAELFASDPILEGMTFEPASTPKKTKKQLAAEAAAAAIDTSAPADEGAHETSVDPNGYDPTYAASGINDDATASQTDDQIGALQF